MLQTGFRKISKRGISSIVTNCCYFCVVCCILGCSWHLNAF